MGTVRGRATPALCVLVLVTGLAAQSSWVDQAPLVGPSAREEHVAVLDRTRQEVVLFGGRRADGVALGDTWTWDATGWHLRAPGGPAPRRAAGLAFDRGAGRTVLFGGFDAMGAPLGDTWVWNGAQWTLANPVAKPSPRAGCALAYDPSGGGVILFGGVDAGGARLGDTWRFDGTSWSRLAPAMAPAPRFGHRLAVDSTRGEILLYGGVGMPAETWVWHNGVWVERSPIVDPGPRERHSLCEDLARDRIVLHGGTDGIAFALADTWEWDGAQWQSRTVAAPPPARLDGILAFDPHGARCIAFGGVDGLGVRGDTWAYGPLFPARAWNFGAGCAGSAGTPRISNQGGDLPWLGDRFVVAVSSLPSTGAVLVHAGLSSTSWGGASLPLALGFAGMPGCTLYAAVDAVAGVPNSGGAAELVFQVPNVAGLRGADVFLQALVIDPGVNQLGVIASDALGIRIGAR